MTSLLDHVRDHAVAGDPASVIDRIDDYSQAHGGMIHLGAAKGRLFDQVVRESGALRVLELGTNYGYSALRLARNLEPAARITTVEIDPQLAETARTIIGIAELGDRIEVICGKAGQVIAGLDQPFDLIFIDHLKEAYLADLRALEKAGLVRAGTVVVSDNVVIFAEQLDAYLRHVRDSGAYESRLYQPSPESDGFEVSVRRGATT
jgi:catechol O-methyltransferase